MIDRFLKDAFGVLSCTFWSTVLQCGARLPIHTLTIGPCSQWFPFSNWAVFESDIAHRRSVWQYCVCCIRSGVTRCTLFKVFYLGRMCQCGLHAMLSSHIGILIQFLAAESRSSAGPLFPSQCPCGTILLTLYSIVWDWWVSSSGPFLFHWPKLLYPIFSSSFFNFLFFLSLGWYYQAGVFALIGCK